MERILEKFPVKQAASCRIRSLGLKLQQTVSSPPPAGTLQHRHLVQLGIAYLEPFSF
jgi:hypothetical protein